MLARCKRTTISSVIVSCIQAIGDVYNWYMGRSIATKSLTPSSKIAGEFLLANRKERCGTQIRSARRGTFLVGEKCRFSAFSQTTRLAGSGLGKVVQRVANCILLRAGPCSATANNGTRDVGTHLPSGNQTTAEPMNALAE